MKKTSIDSVGFALVEAVLVILTLVTIGVAGYFVAAHVEKYNESGTYSYAQYPFPYLPSSFVELSKDRADASDSPSINYKSGSSLKAIKTALIKGCTDNKYTVEGGFITMTSTQDVIPPPDGIKVGKIVKPPDFEMSCDAKGNQWQFDISIDATKMNTYDILITSMSVITNG